MERSSATGTAARPTSPRNKCSNQLTLQTIGEQTNLTYVRTVEKGNFKKIHLPDIAKDGISCGNASDCASKAESSFF